MHKSRKAHLYFFRPCQTVAEGASANIANMHFFTYQVHGSIQKHVTTYISMSSFITMTCSSKLQLYYGTAEEKLQSRENSNTTHTESHGTKTRNERAISQGKSVYFFSLSLSILNSPDRGSHGGSRSRGISCVASELRFVFRCLPRRNSRPDSYVRILGPRAQQLADLLGRLARRFLVKEILFSRR